MMKIQVVFEQAFDVLKGEKSRESLRDAYILAMRFEDETRTNQARRAMVSVNPLWALRRFIHDKDGVLDDSQGMNLAAAKIAKQQELPEEIVLSLINENKNSF